MICDVCEKRRVAIVTREGDGFCAQCRADMQRAWVELLAESSNAPTERA